MRIAIGLGVVLVALHWGALVDPAQVMSGAGGDIQRSFGHWRAFASDELSAGRWPWWNPFAFGGAPFAGSGQSALWYPLTWLSTVLSVGTAIDLELVLHLWWGGIGAAWCLRRRGASEAAQGVAAAGYALGGQLAMHVVAGHVALVGVAAWLPWLFGALSATVIGGWRQVCWTALVVGATLAAGFPQIAAYGLLLGGCEAAVLALAQPDWSKRLASIGRLALALAIGGALAGPPMLALIEMSRESLRSIALSPQAATAYSLPLENLLTLVMPSPMGDSVHHPYWGVGSNGEGCLFLGGAAIGLALASLRQSWRETPAHRWWLWAVICLLLALGSATPLHELSRELPGLDRLRAPARWGVPACLLLALTAGLGLDALNRGRGWRVALGSWWLLLAAAVGGAAALLIWPELLQRRFATLETGGGALAGLGVYDQHTFALSASKHAAIGCGVLAATAVLALAATCTGSWRGRLLAALVWLELIAAAGYLAQSSPLTLGEPDPEVAQLLADELGAGRVVDRRYLANTGTSARVRQVWGRGPECGRRWAELVGASQGRPPRAGSHGTAEERVDAGPWGPSRLLRLTGAKFLLLHPRAEPPPGVRLALRTEQSAVYELPALPHAWLCGRVVLARDDEALSRLRGLDLTRAATVESLPEPLPRDSERRGGRVAVADEAPGLIRVEVTVDAPRLLVISEAWRRGWQLEPLVAAQPRYQLQPANHALLGVALAPGKHVLRLRYRPRTWVLAVSLLLLGLMGWFATFWLSRPLSGAELEVSEISS